MQFTALRFLYAKYRYNYLVMKKNAQVLTCLMYFLN